MSTNKNEYQPLGWKDLLLIFINFLGSIGIVVLVYLLISFILDWII